MFNNFHDKIKLRLNSDDFLLPGEHNKSLKNTGKIIHEILSKIRTGKDVETACEQAFFDG